MVVVERKRAEKHQEYLVKIEHSDLKVFEQILESIPSNSQLQISNSSILDMHNCLLLKTRFAFFAIAEQAELTEVQVTAIGAAFASEKQDRFYYW